MSGILFKRADKSKSALYLLAKSALLLIIQREVPWPPLLYWKSHKR
jgi:hypothetical protein